MTGVINVGVQLPDVIFPVVIRPSGDLTPLISLSFSVSTHLQFMCFTAHVSLFLYILLLRISPVFSPDFLSPFSLYLHLPYWLFKIISSHFHPHVVHDYLLLSGHFIHRIIMAFNWYMWSFWCYNMLIWESSSLITGGVNITLNQSFINAVIMVLLANSPRHIKQYHFKMLAKTLQ